MKLLALLTGALVLLAACAPATPPSSISTLYVLRLDPPALIQLDAQNQTSHAFPLTIPEGCGLGSVYPSPHGLRLVIELSCSFGPAVIWMDAASGRLTQPVTSSDSHFLAWSSLGDALYLKVDTINRPRIVRLDLAGRQQPLPIDGFTYDVSSKPGGGGISFAFSRGLGLGSELWLAQADGTHPQQIAADAANYLSLARWSPDGAQLAVIKVPDSATPFTMGELWVMRADGSAARPLARVDAGHGYPPVWSPDGRNIVFVARENAQDPRADQSVQALISNLAIVSIADGSERALTTFDFARVESPAWQPDGNIIAFTVVVNDRMTVYLKDVVSGRLQQIDVGPACCPAWLTP